MPLFIEIKPPRRLPRVLRGSRARDIFSQFAVPVSKRMADIATDALVDASPVGATGNLRKAWPAGRSTRIESRAVVQLITASGRQGIKANVWDSGAKPHFPPHIPLRFWVRRKLANIVDLVGTPDQAAYAIRRAISRRGLPNLAHPEGHKVGLFSKAIEEVTPRIQRLHRTMLNAMVVKLNA